jgi:hypothetical protein
MPDMQIAVGVGPRDGYVYILRFSRHRYSLQ